MFVYQYTWERSTNLIRAYGVNEEGSSVCFTVTNFLPYCYLALPDHMDWSSPQRWQNVVTTLTQYMKDNKPKTAKFEYLSKLYYAKLDALTGNRLKYPFVRLKMPTPDAVRHLKNIINKPFHYPGMGAIQLRLHEHNADPVLQFICQHDLPSCGWIQLPRDAVEIGKSMKITHTQKEYEVMAGQLVRIERESIPPIQILVFDIEVYSSAGDNVFPDAKNLDDCIFQISCVLSHPQKSILLTLGNPYEIEGVEVIRCENETALLLQFANLIVSEGVQLISGFNTFQFDWPYILARAAFPCQCLSQILQCSYYKDTPASTIKYRPERKSRTNKTYPVPDFEGRVQIDWYVIACRDLKLDMYKLDTVAFHLLKDKKEDLAAKDIFAGYRMRDDPKVGRDLMTKVGTYAMKDADLVMRIMRQTETWFNLVQKAYTFNSPIFNVYARGEQVKVFSQVYRFCTAQKMVVEHEGYIARPDEEFTGATVLDPVPGLYRNVCPLDFQSMYPNIIVGYNIDYSTLVDDPSVPDSDCHVVEWSEHRLCGCEEDVDYRKYLALTEQITSQKADIKKISDPAKTKKAKDTLRPTLDGMRAKLGKLVQVRAEVKEKLPKRKMCANFRYRFLRSPPGVLPTIIRNLLQSRANTRARLKNEEDPVMRSVLQQRQLSEKVAANSMYGSMGTKTGFLPFMPGATCVTRKGRENLLITQQLVRENYGGQVIYSDTDSAYCIFPHLTDYEELWNRAIEVARLISTHFPPPTKLEFEKAIYTQFLIFKKKKYVYRALEVENGSTKENLKIGKRGVVISRRDNCSLLRTLYEEVVELVFSGARYPEISTFICDKVYGIFSRVYGYNSFIITQKCNDTDGYKVVLDDLGKARVGHYSVKQLSDDPEMKSKQLAAKRAVTDREYYERSVVGVAQLGERIRQRGGHVAPGERLEFVVLNRGVKNDKMGDKMEELGYYRTRTRYLRLDWNYYLRQMETPLDQLLSAAFKNRQKEGTNLVARLVEVHKKRQQCMKELKSL